MSSYRSRQNSRGYNQPSQRTFSIERPIAKDQLATYKKVAGLILAQSTRQSEAVPAPKKLVIFPEPDITRLFQHSEFKRYGIGKFRDDLVSELGRRTTGDGLRLKAGILEVSEETVVGPSWYDLNLMLETDPDYDPILHEQDIILGAIRKLGDMQGGRVPDRIKSLPLGRFSSIPNMELINEIRDQIPEGTRIHFAAAQITALGLAQPIQTSLAS